MATLHNLGFPRVGQHRELKFALEAFWAGQSSLEALDDTGRRLRAQHWQQQHAAGCQWVPVGDFAWYDQVLQHLALFGALPARFGFAADTVGLPELFAAARGNASQPAMEMTKWFDTNYHYLVPEWHADTRFSLQAEWWLAPLQEAQALGIAAKPVLIGPLTLLWLGKSKTAGFDPLELLPRLVPEYRRLLKALATAGASWVQIDEPILALDLPERWKAALFSTYRQLALEPVSLLLASYFESVAEHAQALATLPVAGVHLDLVRAPQQLSAFLSRWPANKVLSLGIIDGRNIWRADLERALATLQEAQQHLQEQLWLAPSCSLLHVPFSAADETLDDPLIAANLAFAVEKLQELHWLATALRSGELPAQARACQAARVALAAHPSRQVPAVRERLAALEARDERRISAYAARHAAQQARLQLPLWPTTTIGSFPQTREIRAARAAYRRGELSERDYTLAMRAEIRQVIEEQLALGLDVLVHGEAERNDMVEYFGEQLAGFAFTRNGWVQSYGSRCVKPPIIYGDVHRPQAMTVAWAAYAQSLSPKPVKGMLTGPVTILQWSFVRDDQPRAHTATQIALAIRDEVIDLENAGIAIIQIDEPAFREGLPLKRADWEHYLNWAVRAFRLSSAAVDDATQIHTHMCYAEFNDILPAIAALDADVITIETARSDLELLQGFADFAYPNGIGPGVYDIHSPRVPRIEAMAQLLEKAAQVIPAAQLWVNPDCGLKTRGWPETRAALANLVAAAKAVRAQQAEVSC